MDIKTKFCKHCGETIDYDCVICTKCGKQVEELKGSSEKNIVINNSATSNSTVSNKCRKIPWYLRWFWIIILGCFTSGIYFVIGIIMRVIWKSNN